MNDKKITLYELTLILAGTSIAVGLLIGAYQLYQWQVFGLQVKMSVLDAIFFVDENIFPMGTLPPYLYRVLRTVPVAFVGVLFGILLLLLAFSGAKFKKDFFRA